MNFSRTFVDTGGFMALMCKQDHFHAKAEELFSSFFARPKVSLVTSDYVLDECLTLMRCRFGFSAKKCRDFILDFHVSRITVYCIGQGIFHDALELMQQYDDHDFSFTDCVSFVMMKDLKIKSAITTDKHFTIAGFDNLLLT